MGAVYGYASRHLRHSGQLIEAMSCLISRYAGYFVTLFFIVQFFSVLSYTRLSVCLGVSDSFMNAVLVVVSYLPLISVFVRGGRK
jgi:aminobenzoyl-glutamate transport protein